MNGKNAAHWACTILAMVVAVVAVVNSTNQRKQINDLKQQLSAKADTAAVNSRFNVVETSRQEGQIGFGARISALEDSLTSVREYAESVDVKTDENFSNLIGIREHIGWTK